MRDENFQQQQEQEAEAWNEYNRRLIDETHEIVEVEIKPRIGHLVQLTAQQYCANQKGT